MCPLFFANPEFCIIQRLSGIKNSFYQAVSIGLLHCLWRQQPTEELEEFTRQEGTFIGAAKEAFLFCVICVTCNKTYT